MIRGEFPCIECAERRCSSGLDGPHGQLPFGHFLFRSKDSLVLNSWVHRLVDGSLMLPISGEEIRNSCFRFIYFVRFGMSETIDVEEIR